MIIIDCFQSKLVDAIISNLVQFQANTHHSYFIASGHGWLLCSYLPIIFSHNWLRNNWSDQKYVISNLVQIQANTHHSYFIASGHGWLPTMQLPTYYLQSQLNAQ